MNILKNGVTPDDIFHDVYLRSSKGLWTQIDCVIVTGDGLWVIEHKKYSGWIFGSGYQKYWTKVMSYGKVKYKFYNPIMQNRRHIQTLKDQWHLIYSIPIHSYIVFSGKCKIKKLQDIPQDIWVGYANKFYKELSKSLKYYPSHQLHHREEIKRILKQGVNNGNDKNIVKEHAQYVRKKSRQMPSNSLLQSILRILRK